MDAALSWPSGKSYLFDGSTYQRWLPDGTCDACDQSIADNWPGLWQEGVDAAVWWGYGKAYFFRGAEYARYDLAQDKAEYTKPIAAGWPGLWADGIDAAVNWGNGKIYFFKGSEYARWDITTDALDSGYPRAIAGAWAGLEEGVDAALYQGGRYAYFFKGGRVRTYDVAADRVVDDRAASAFAPESVPDGLIEAARDLSPERAAQVAAYYANLGRYTFLDSWTALRRDGAGAVNWIDPARHVTIQPAAINGIAFKIAANPSAPRIDNLDVRMLVVLERLTRWLNAGRADISAIHHLGIGHGQGQPNDCHNQGRALDFAGVTGQADGAEFTRLVKRDWGNLPDTGGYRIASSSDPLAHDLFLTTYAFATYECECRRGNVYPPTEIGEGGMVICPDYPSNTPDSASLKRAHQDHIHMQVGPTRA